MSYNKDILKIVVLKLLSGEKIVGSVNSTNFLNLNENKDTFQNDFYILYNPAILSVTYDKSLEMHYMDFKDYSPYSNQHYAPIRKKHVTSFCDARDELIKMYNDYYNLPHLNNEDDINNQILKTTKFSDDDVQ